MESSLTTCLRDIVKLAQKSRLVLYNELLDIVKSADKQGGYIKLGGRFGAKDTYINAMRLSPKGEYEEEVRDLEFLCDGLCWLDNILQCDDIFPDNCLRSILNNISHGNFCFRAYH